MPVRLTRLLTAALISASLSTVVFAATTQSLTWRGDVVTANSVVKGMAKAWQTSGHGHIEMQPFNTASGLDAVASGAADLAGSARPNSGSAVDSGLTFTPVAWDGLVLITNPSNPVNSLTLQQVHDIYFGKITNWKDVGGNDAPMDVFAVASPGDGVEYSLRKLLFGRGSQPVAAPRLYVNTTQLEASVALDPRAFGVTMLSSVAGDPKIKMLRIDGVAPSISSVSSGSYPLFTEIYLVTNPSSPKAANAKEFVDFTQSAKGTAVLRQHSLVPYAEGNALIAMDASRRSRILAAVGAHASAEPTQVASATPVRPAVTPASVAAASRTVVAATPGLKNVSGSVVAAPEPRSLKSVRGDAFTVADATTHGTSFAKVTADAYVSYGKVLAKVSTRASKTTAADKKIDAKKIANTPKAPARTYKVAAGETLYSIARKHGVDVAQIRSWNHLKDNTVRAGQVLHIDAR
ncbi:LysM peptidoglycan-binding domain-containing protein [Dyella sp. M7H15-1]|uniref:LysM peptidoglycan-binding domain-containing protein n=1 Tax=Dyella sp. M7H15-1 TaxID=2501295 RepID=UPI0010050D13|nr:substrate-binding domain-containing protein [Dyella sp. M7H15-1]QAU25048.1 LysM peptidoglycan-binding domain-containing protein [Dyella sp. M7H15-1]